MSEVRVSIVVLNLNGRHFLADCLNAVLKQEAAPFETILVDNGSTDGSVEFLRQNFPEVRIIEAGRNLGFAEGNNLGVRSARADLVVLLNNDTVVAPGWLNALLQSMEAEDVAVASSLILTRGVPEKYYRRTGSLNLLGHNIMEVFGDRRNLFYCGGASLIFKRSILGEPFDPKYFVYSEDVYLSLRARFMGYRVIQVSESVVDHIGGGTTGGRKSVRVAMVQERNRILNLMLFFSAWTVIRVMPLLVAVSVAKLLAGIFSPQYPFRGMVWAWAWLKTHPRYILKRRKAMAAQKRIPESQVISWMSGRVLGGSSIVSRAVDAVALVYLRLVGIRTVECFPDRTR
jgi:hypothetical protein